MPTSGQAEYLSNASFRLCTALYVSTLVENVVQRDLLPIVEGSAVNTKYGIVNTHRILFIAIGAFHVSKPSALVPELQGRFPLRVELVEVRLRGTVKKP